MVAKKGKKSDSPGSSGAMSCDYCNSTSSGRYVRTEVGTYCDNGRCGMNASRARRGLGPKPPFGEG